jgi:glycosyltransferase involved in cell wall biosynthesis
MKKKLPFVSVIIITYNGAKRIKFCLNSIIKQNYPKNKYEIIIVDDGSQDNNLEIISKFKKIQLFQHRKNKGIPFGRNTGIKNAKGEIIVYIDDDCIADKNWLKELIKPYSDDSVIGVGGFTKANTPETFAEKYMANMEYGNPAPIQLRKKNNIFARFFIYLKHMDNPINSKEKKIIQVHDIYTLNASFKIKFLKKIKGFDENLQTSEDSDICRRLNLKFRDKKLVFNSNAIVSHKHRTSFFRFFKQNFFRSINVSKFYKKHKMFPPIFPFPIAILFLFFASIFINIPMMIISLILLPQIFYFWWGIKFINKLKIEYLIFPYAQFLMELSTLAGLFRGSILLKLKNGNKK